EGEAAFRSMSKRERYQRWQRAGLNTDNQIDDARLFRVSIVHLEPIGLARVLEREMRSFEMSKNWFDDHVLRRVVRTAIQALYVMNLDIGEVIVALSEQGKTAIRQIDLNWNHKIKEREAYSCFAKWYSKVREQLHSSSKEL